ncbi:MAG TPA: MBL fold metallo-hydrolase, partial [Methylophaga sp.]|nr:MBL fold metallo-hydrolase [Methylophaga sp.]
VIINDLGTIEQAIDSVGTQEAEKWKLFEEYHRRNVTAAFVELEWE